MPIAGAERETLVAEIVDGFDLAAVAVDVGNAQDGRKSARLILRIGEDFQGAEPLADRDMLGFAEFLAAQDDDGVLIDSRVPDCEGLVRQRPRQFEADDFCAKALIQSTNFDSGHVVLPSGRKSLGRILRKLSRRGKGARRNSAVALSPDRQSGYMSRSAVGA